MAWYVRQPLSTQPSPICNNLQLEQLSTSRVAELLGVCRLLRAALQGAPSLHNNNRDSLEVAIEEAWVCILNRLPSQRLFFTAIPAFILSTRRVLQYTTNGVWIGHTLPPVTLPSSITCLFSEWQTSSATTFVYFRKYLPTLSEVCVRDDSVDKQVTFMHDSSINMCRERINHAAANHTKQVVEHEWRDDQDSLDQLEDLLEPRHSKALMDMSRLNPKNRQSNEKFGISLRRKLRLSLWPGEDKPVCCCGKSMDQFGDHLLSCRSHCKTAMSDKTRDGLASLMKRIYPLVKLVSSDKCVETETPRIVKRMPNIRPFDFSVLLDPLLDETAWRTPLFRLGFDVTYIKSTPLTSSKSKAARISDINMRLSTRLCLSYVA